MFDTVQTQDDLTGLLLSDDRLKSVNIKSYRKMRIAQEIDYRTLVTLPRNGLSGSGILVAFPVALSKNPNVSGPVIDWQFPIISMEEPNLSMSIRTGTQLTAEQLAQYIMDILHLYADDLVGNFQVEKEAVKAESEYSFPGLVCYRTNLTVTGKNIQSSRCSPVIVSIALGLATLTCATASSRIKYTLDGTFPGEDIAGNSGSLLYSTPFAVTSGQTIRATAYKLGLINSATRGVVVP